MARDWLLHQPLTGSGILVYAEGLDLRMHEDVDGGGDPALPVMPGDDGNALDLALMVLDEQDVFFQSLLATWCLTSAATACR